MCFFGEYMKIAVKDCKITLRWQGMKVADTIIDLKMWKYFAIVSIQKSRG
jgi:hypothetical protein